MRILFYSSLLLVILTTIACGSRRDVASQGIYYPPSGNRVPPVKNSQNIPKSGTEYIEQYKAIAINEMAQYGIPASIKMAQAILESGSGKSYLAQNANNHFGIKCGGQWSGRRISRADDTPNDCFRVYNSPEQSFRDHSIFLLQQRYKRLFTLDRRDYKGWAHGLKAAGYATNPRYAQLLIDIIERYELYRLDEPQNVPAQRAREQYAASVDERPKNPPVQEERVHLSEEKSTTVEEKVESSTNRVEKKTPAMTIYEVKQGDTLHSIAKNYQITVDQLKQINGLSNEKLDIGQLLVVSF